MFLTCNCGIVEIELSHGIQKAYAVGSVLNTNVLIIVCNGNVIIENGGFVHLVGKSHSTKYFNLHINSLCNKNKGNLPWPVDKKLTFPQSIFLRWKRLLTINSI